MQGPQDQLQPSGALLAQIISNETLPPYNARAITMKVFTYLIILLFMLQSLTSLAYTECQRGVKKVWTNLSASKGFWVVFDDGGSSIYKEENQLTEGQMSRFVSLALTALTAGKSLIVRYPENDLSCPPTNGDRNDIEGIWLESE